MLTSGLSPDPILQAVEQFKGTFIELDSGREVTGDALRKWKEDLRSQVRRQGVADGDRVVMAIPNGPLFPAALTALLEAGGSPLLVHADTPSAELERIAERWGARFVARAPDGLALTLEEVREHEPTPGLSFGGVPFHPTSGTTHAPKVALRPGPCAVAEAEHYIETMAIDATDCVLCTTPMSHAYAYGMCVMVPLLASANVVTLRDFNPKRVRRALDERGVTLLPTVPAMLDLLLLGAAGHSLTAPRLLLSAGAPLTQKTADAYRDRYGIRVRSLYGTTETGGISVNLDPADDAPECAGPPMRGVEVRLRATEEGDHGILQVRSSSMMTGYLGDNAIEPGYDEEGFFETGDIAHLTGGRIHLVGRESDVINVFGLKVLPSEVESVIAALPQVAEVKIYAGRHRSGSQRVQAAIVTSEPLDETTLRNHCRDHLVAHKCPEIIRFLPALPRTAAGKIIRSQLP